MSGETILKGTNRIEENQAKFGRNCKSLFFQVNIYYSYKTVQSEYAKTHTNNCYIGI